MTFKLEGALCRVLKAPRVRLIVARRVEREPRRVAEKEAFEPYAGACSMTLG
jgi:hypothetical protein